MSLFPRCLPRLSVPAALLLAFLHRAPLVPAAVTTALRVLSPLAASVLRATALTTAALGATHSLAGASMYVSNPSGPLAATVGTRASAAFALTGTPRPPQSWRVTGPLPPGLSVSGRSGPTPINLNTVSLTLTGTPTVAGTYTLTLQAWEYTGQAGLSPGIFSYTIAVAPAPVVNAPPTLTAQPQTQSALVGTSVTLSAAASGTPTPIFQWRKDDADLPGATAATLALTSLQLSDAGTYTLVATNSVGSATSAPAILTVTPPPIVAPPIITPPVIVPPVVAPPIVTPPPVVAPPPVTPPVVTPPVVTPPVDAPRVITPPASEPALPPARLANLAIRSTAGAGARTLILGVTLGGGEAGVTQPVLVRGVGPSLGVFGVVGFLPDPALTVFRGAAIVAANDDWAGETEATLATARAGAFVLSAPSSRDAALVGRFAPGSYTVQVSASPRTPAPGGPGLALAEIYDVATAAPGGPPLARFTNLSARTHVGAGADILIAGFVISGAGTQTLLLRGVGPTLGVFGVADTLADPKLELYSGATLLAANDDWAGAANLALAAARVGAFALANPASKDAALLVTLPAGAYTVQVSGAGGATGTALVEVYEVP